MLIRNALAIMTGLPGDRARAPGGDIRVDAQGRIAAIGRLAPAAGERGLDATDCVVYPGWINPHHPLAQSVLRGVPAGINLPLAGWLGAGGYPYPPPLDAHAPAPA